MYFVGNKFTTTTTTYTILQRHRLLYIDLFAIFKCDVIHLDHFEIEIFWKYQKGLRVTGKRLWYCLSILRKPRVHSGRISFCSGIDIPSLAWMMREDFRHSIKFVQSQLNLNLRDPCTSVKKFTNDAGGVYYDYYPGALSLNQVTTTPVKSACELSTREIPIGNAQFSTLSHCMDYLDFYASANGIASAFLSLHVKFRHHHMVFTFRLCLFVSKFVWPHWDRDEMADIVQTTYSKAFLWREIIVFDSNLTQISS